MKLKLFALTLIIATFANAQVTIVDNNGNAPAGVETSLTTAISNATAGDTLLIIPSSSTYGSISISKELTLIGVGFNPDMEIPFTSTVANLTIQTAASGTKIIGMNITGPITLGNTTGTLSDIVIENNRINYITHSGISSLVNTIIRQNVIRVTSTNISDITLTVANQSNIMVTNNVFSKTGNSSAYRGPYVTTGGVTFDHNLFLGGTSNYAFYQLVNCTVSNNIFLTVLPGTNTISTTNNTYRNNLSNTASAFTTMAGTNFNLVDNIEGDPVFVNLPNTTVTYGYDLDPTLLSGPGELAGSDGTNIGVDGGTSPFKLSGSVLPVVRRFDLPTNIVQGSDANATIEVTGN